jgi:hypothetical protein
MIVLIDQMNRSVIEGKRGEYARPTQSTPVLIPHPPRRDMAWRGLLLSLSLLIRVRPLIMSAFANHDTVIPIER